MQKAKTWLRSRIPAIARRDAIIQRQREQIDRLTRKVESRSAQIKALDRRLRQEQAQAQETRERLLRSTGRPSFRREVLSLRNAQRIVRTVDAEYLTPFSQIPHKLRNYHLAVSHGVRTPEVLAVWSSVEEIDLTAMPGEFVLKADGGAGGVSVFLLRRASSGVFESLDGSQRLTLAQIKARFVELGPRRARPPFFAEEVLDVHASAGAIPEDVKIYTAYGEVLQVMLRRVGTHRDPASIRYRYLTEDREDLGQADRFRTMDHDLPVPQGFDDMTGIARHLSRAAGVPFCRVDLYDTPGEPTLGEITRAPGGDHFYSRRHDRQMGAAVVAAQIRLEQDLVRGRPSGALFGTIAQPDPYGAVTLPPEISNPRDWPVHTIPCGRWC